MENLEWKNLKLWTSYVSEELLKEFIERNILPVFIARRIDNSTLIGRWQGTSVHIPELAPSPGLLRDWKYRGMSYQVFQEEFKKELNQVRLSKILGKLWTMSQLCGAQGVVMLGYGRDMNQDHRKTVSDYINATGLLENPIKELIL